MNDSKKFDVDMQNDVGGGNNHNDGHMMTEVSESYGDEESTMLLSNGNGDDANNDRQQQQQQEQQQQNNNSGTTAKLRPKKKKNKSLTGQTGAFPESATRIRARKRIEARQKTTESIIKYSALALLIGQMVGLVLLMRYSRTVVRPPDTPLYLASSAVFVMEVMKLVICTIVVMVQSNTSILTEIRIHIIQSPNEMLKLCIPSLLYTVQNNLLYLALTNLDAATYQVAYQLKILTTAVFSSILLQRKFSPLKWMSLVILTIGVAIVEISGSGDHHTLKESSTDSNRNHLIGMIAVLCAACTSGFSGVYFEKILKGSTTSLWIRNIQMGLPSVIIAYITCYVKDSTDISTQGLLGGYTPIVWLVVIVQAVGGLIVATVVKYADNVLKVFATSFSIIISCIISAIFFDFHPTLLFIIGTSFVVAATVMYSAPEKTILSLSNSSPSRPILPMRK